MGKLKSKLDSLRPMMASAAQKVIDEWKQDEDGIDEVYGSGGACDQVASALIDVIYDHLDVDAVFGAPEGDDHEWVVVSNGIEGCIVDIPSHVYETGGGYSWKKIEGATVDPQDILIYEVKRDDIKDLFEGEGNYAQDCMYNMSADGMDEDLWQLLDDDAGTFKSLNVKNDRERNLYFYLDNFYDDLCEEFGCAQSELRHDIIESAFNKLRTEESPDLTDIRTAVYKAIRDFSPTHKVAYPNISGVHEINLKPRRNVEEWIRTLGEIHTATEAGESREVVLQRLTEDWSLMAKLDFDAWTRFYERGDHEKYAAIYRVAFPTPYIPGSEEVSIPEEEEGREEGREETAVRRPGRPRKKVRTPDDLKRGLISRLDSADKLLREFSHVWPTGVWNRLHSSLNDLKREVMTLKSATTVRDVIVKTAGMWSKSGFKEGASLLEKIAQPPEMEGDVASEIEQALTGKEYKSKEAPAPAPEEVPADFELSPEELDAVPPEGAGEELPMPESPEGDAAMADLEAPVEEEVEEPKLDLEEEVEEPEVDTNIEDNPYRGSSIKDVVDVLEPVVLELKERAVARELAKVDMMLDAQNIASHFPELGEAMNKVLESNTYVTTRLDKLLTKVKGGIQEIEKGDEGKITPPSAPDINMDELADPPADEGLLEVEEEMAPAAPKAPAAPQEPEPALEVEEDDLTAVPSKIDDLAKRR